MRQLQQFLFVVVDAPSDTQTERLLDRCEDAVIEVDPVRGMVRVAFDREAPTLADAIVSAVRDIEGVGLGPIEVREDDEVVSLGVVAERIGRSVEVVRDWASRRGGPGGFPEPLLDHPRRPCYRWGDVEPWLGLHCGHRASGVGNDAVTFAAVNLALKLRALAPRVERMSALRALLPW